MHTQQLTTAATAATFAANPFASKFVKKIHSTHSS